MNKYDLDNGVPVPFYDSSKKGETEDLRYGPCPDCAGSVVTRVAYYYHRETFRHTGVCPPITEKDVTRGFPKQSVVLKNRCACGELHTNDGDLCGVCLFGPLATANRILGIKEN